MWHYSFIWRCGWVAQHIHDSYHTVWRMSAARHASSNHMWMSHVTYDSCPIVWLTTWVRLVSNSVTYQVEMSCLEWLVSNSVTHYLIHQVGMSRVHMNESCHIAWLTYEFSSHVNDLCHVAWRVWCVCVCVCVCVRVCVWVCVGVCGCVWMCMST